MAGNSLTIIERKILDAAASGMSPAEISEAYYMPAEQVVTKVRELLAQRDVWDEIEQRKLLVHSLLRVKGEIERFSIDVSDPKHIEAYTKLVLAIDRISEKQTKITDAELDRVSAAQAVVLVQMVEMAYNRAKQLLAAEYPFITLDVIDEAFNEGLRDAVALIEA